MQRNLKSGQGITYSIFGGNKLTQNDVQSITNYANALKSGVGTGEAWTTNMKNCSVAAKQYVVSAKRAGQSTDELVTGLKTVPKVTTAASAGLKALSIAGNMLAMWAITEGIQLAAKLVDKLIVTTEELKEAADNAVNELNNLQSETDSLNQELTTTRDRITELENKPSLSFIEQEELQKLRDASTELERQIELNKTLLNVQEGKTRDSALDYLNKQTQYEGYGGWDMSQVRNGNARYGTQNVGTIFQGNQLEVAQRQLQEYENIAKQKENVEKRITSFKIANPDETKYTLEQKDALTNLQLELQSYDSTLKVLNDSLYDVVPNLDTYKNVLNPDYDQSYIDFIDKIIDGYNQLFGDSSGTKIEKFNDIWNSDDFKTYKSELESLAKDGKLDASVLESNEQYKKLLEETGATAEETAQHINSLVSAEQGTANVNESDISFLDIESKVQSLSKGLDQLDSIYADILDGEDFDWSSILNNDGFAEAFGNMTNVTDEYKTAYDDFIKTISNSPNDINACQNAFNNLATAYIQNSGILDELTEETKDATISMLEMMGVANADVLVQNALAEARAQAVWESQNLANATSSEIIALVNEEEATNNTGEAFGTYLVQKMLAEAAIDTSGDISALANVVASLGLATSAWQRYYAAKQRMAQISADPNYVGFEEDGSIVSKETVLAQYSKIAEDSLAEYAKELENNAQKANYSGGNKSNKNSGSSKSGSRSGSSSDSKAKELKEEFNWLQRLDEYYQKQHDIQSKIAEDETASYSERIAALKEMTNLDKERMGSATKTASEYLNKWNDIKKQLDPKYIAKIMYGDISDEEITALEDSDLADQIELIKLGIDYYDKWQDADEKKLELQEECTDRLREELELQQELIQAQQEMLQSEMDIVQSKIDYIEASGGVVTSGYYEEQIRLSKQISDSYEDQIDNLRKQQEMVEDESAEYYSLESQINDCEKAIIECKTQQAEWNEAIKRLPVERLQKYINMLKAIKQELEDFLDYQETIGQPTTKDQFQQLLEINQEQIESLQKQAEELQGLLGDYKYGSEKFDKVANELSDIQNETANLVNQMQEYNNQILNIPIENLQKVNEELERYSSILSGVMSDYDSALDAVLTLIDDQVQSIEDLKEETEDYYDEQTEKLQDELDLLEDTNEAREKEISLEKAKYELERAQSQRTNKVKNCLLLQ